MPDASSPDVEQVVPLLGVTDVSASLRFYVDGLGFRVTKTWEPDGQIRWCWLELGSAALMVQQRGDHGQPPEPVSQPLGLGVSLCLMCKDALTIYDRAKARGLAPREQFVGNRLWVTSFTDPDGYRLDFESPTDAPEEIKLSEWRQRA